MLFAALMLFSLWRQKGRTQLREKIIAAGLNPDKPFEELTDEEYFRIRKVVVEATDQFKDVPQTDYSTSKEQTILATIEGLAEVRTIKNLSVAGTILFLLVWLVFFLVPVGVLFLS